MTALIVAFSIFIGVPLALILLGVAFGYHKEPIDYDLPKPTDRKKPDTDNEKP